MSKRIKTNNICLDAMSIIMSMVPSFRQFDAMQTSCKTLHTLAESRLGKSHLQKYCVQLLPDAWSYNHTLQYLRNQCQICGQGRVKQIKLPWNIYAHKHCIQRLTMSEYHVQQRYALSDTILSSLLHEWRSGYNPYVSYASYRAWQAKYYWLRQGYGVTDENTIEYHVSQKYNITWDDFDQHLIKLEQERQQKLLEQKRLQEAEAQRKQLKRKRLEEKRQDVMVKRRKRLLDHDLSPLTIQDIEQYAQKGYLNHRVTASCSFQTQLQLLQQYRDVHMKLIQEGVDPKTIDYRRIMDYVEGKCKWEHLIVKQEQYNMNRCLSCQQRDPAQKCPYAMCGSCCPGCARHKRS